MAKVHPKSVPVAVPNTAAINLPPDSGGEASVLTVWRKSLLLNFDGFTVFDAKGDLVFRVDNYASGGRGVVVLMDAAGVPLLTIRRKVNTTRRPPPFHKTTRADPGRVHDSHKSLPCYARPP